MTPLPKKTKKLGVWVGCRPPLCDVCELDAGLHVHRWSKLSKNQEAIDAVRNGKSLRQTLRQSPVKLSKTKQLMHDVAEACDDIDINNIDRDQVIRLVQLGKRCRDMIRE